MTDGVVLRPFDPPPRRWASLGAVHGFQEERQGSRSANSGWLALTAGCPDHRRSLTAHSTSSQSDSGPVSLVERVTAGTAPAFRC